MENNFNRHYNRSGLKNRDFLNIDHNVVSMSNAHGLLRVQTHLEFELFRVKSTLKYFKTDAESQHISI